MSETHWVVIAKPGGAIIDRDFLTNGAHPRFEGLAWNSEAMECHQTNRAPTELDTLNRTTWQWEEDAAKMEADLVGKIKVISERLSMRVLTSGGAKKLKYSDKGKELDAWYALGPVGAAVNILLTALALLSPAEQARRFPYASAEKNKRGEANISFAMARFEAGRTVSRTEAARLEAVETDAVARIKAASTAAAKKSAYTATDWGVSAQVMQQAMLNVGF